jgi:hypothetical protein
MRGIPNQIRLASRLEIAPYSRWPRTFTRAALNVRALAVEEAADFLEQLSYGERRRSQNRLHSAALALPREVGEANKIGNVSNRLGKNGFFDLQGFSSHSPKRGQPATSKSPSALAAKSRSKRFGCSSVQNSAR